MVRRKGDKKKEPPGGRAAERLRQFEEQRGYPITPEEEQERLRRERSRRDEKGRETTGDNETSGKGS